MRWILIDGGWLAHRVLHSFGPEWRVSDDPWGFLFGLLDQLRGFCYDPRFESSRIAFFLDSKHSHRKRLDPTYKGNRAAMTPDERVELDVMREQMKVAIGDIFPRIGIPTYGEEGYEADDLIASAARGLGGTGEPGVMITSDGDLFQCISDEVEWYDPTRRRYLTRSLFCGEKGIYPSRWGEVKAIAGCPGDNVVGVKGVGETTAVKYLLGVLPTHQKVWRTLSCERSIRLIQHNRRLVVLPFEGLTPVKLREPEWSLEGFKAVCRKYEFDSLMHGKRYHDWCGILTGRMTLSDRQIPRRVGEKRST